MRIAFAVLGAVLALQTFDVQADEGLPSQAVIAEMGLSGMQVLSDSEAYEIRGSGFVWGWGKSNFSHRDIGFKFRFLVFKFHKHIKEFHRSLHIPTHFPTPKHKPRSDMNHMSPGMVW